MICRSTGTKHCLVSREVDRGFAGALVESNTGIVVDKGNKKETKRHQNGQQEYKRELMSKDFCGAIAAAFNY